jgi:hypothetical protein
MPGMKNHGAGHGHVDIEWEDTMPLHNRLTTPTNMFWKLVNRETGAENHAIQWSFRLGQRTKIRIVNEPRSDRLRRGLRNSAQWPRWIDSGDGARVRSRSARFD